MISWKAESSCLYYSDISIPGQCLVSFASFKGKITKDVKVEKGALTQTIHVYLSFKL
jgi:hypothetical protein